MWRSGQINRFLRYGKRYFAAGFPAGRVAGDAGTTMVLLPLTSISNIHSVVGLQARMQCATAFVLAIPGLGHGLGFTLAGGADFPCVDSLFREVFLHGKGASLRELLVVIDATKTTTL